MIEICIECRICGEDNRVYVQDNAPSAPVCTECFAELFYASVIKGFIYILSNRAMPGVVKIGYSTRPVSERARELETTGVPEPFTVEAYFTSDQPERHEASIHRALRPYQLAGKEFFRLEPSGALRAVSKILNRDPAYSLYSRAGRRTGCYGKFYHYRDAGSECKLCSAKQKCIEASL